MTDTILNIQNLTKRYAHAKYKALNGIDLAVNKGEFFGLLGPNGSGKTTMVSIVCGLLSASSGGAEMLGVKVPRKIGPIKPKFGLVPQEIALYPTLTLKENLRYFGHLYGLRRKRLKNQINKYIELVGLEKFTKVAVGKFSGGMQRRANLITSLLHDPELLFLDEPTANVDPQSCHVILQILKKLNNEGMTLIYTTHHLHEAEAYCARVAIIDRGSVVAVDSPQTLITDTPNSENLGDVFFNLTGHGLRD